MVKNTDLTVQNNSTELLQGRIVKASGGFYEVDTPHGRLMCRARGLFRKEGITPYVGDEVSVELIPPDKGTVAVIHPRRNSLIRPPLANIDRLAIVASTTEPLPNPLIIDTMTAIAHRRGITPMIIISKSDMACPNVQQDIYKKAGYRVFTVDSLAGNGVAEVALELAGKTTAFTGNSGVGKSTLLNALHPDLALQTAEISQKLGRGRHTTRHVELFRLPNGGYVADTPGFSAIDFVRFERMTADGLEDCFPEFASHIPHCKFTGCSHTKERGCAVLEAVQSGEIPLQRHQSYLQLFEQLREIKQWQIEKDDREHSGGKHGKAK